MLSLWMGSSVESAQDADLKGREMAEVENQSNLFIHFKRAYFSQILKSSLMSLVNFAKRQCRRIFILKDSTPTFEHCRDDRVKKKKNDKAGHHENFPWSAVSFAKQAGCW